jgi:predicted dehydrogenase
MSDQPTTSSRTVANGAQAQPPTIGIGLIGGGFVGRAHALALRSLPLHSSPPPARPELRILADASEQLAVSAARDFEFAAATEHWQEVVESDDVDVVVIATPNNLHRDIVLAAAARGKHVVCEKPLGLHAGEALEMYRAVHAAGVQHMVAFNYRRVPAVTFAAQLVRDGVVGRVRTFRGRYLHDGNIDPAAPLVWRHRKAQAGAGVLADVGSHVVDVARYLVGDVRRVTSQLRTWVTSRPVAAGSAIRADVEVEDEAALLVDFDSGAIGIIEASTCAPGRRNHLAFEINGERGTIVFDYERLGELHLYLASDARQVQGFRTIRVGSAHPYGRLFYPNDAFGIGFTETKVAEWHDFLGALVAGQAIAPDFYDGYLANLVVDRALEAVDGWATIEEEPR